MRPFSTACLALWCFVFSASVTAQNQLSLGELAAGQLVLNLNASEAAEVEQDTLNASMEFSVQGRDQRDLQDKVNVALKQALESAKAVASVNVETGQYQVYQVQNEPGIFSADNPVWRAQQSLQLDSLDNAALLELVGRLQEQGLIVMSLYYSLSESRREQVASELTTQLLQTLQRRAENAGQALGKPHAALVEVSLDGNASLPMQREAFAMAAMAMDSKIAPPVSEPGETTVTVSVSARAILSP